MQIQLLQWIEEGSGLVTPKSVDAEWHQFRERPSHKLGPVARFR